MGTTPATDNDRRDQKRMGVRLPIALEWRGGHGTIRRTRGITRDISRRGMYCFVEEPIPDGQPIDFDVVFPGELTATHPLALHCRATAVRTEVQERRFGLAAAIQAREPIELGDPAPDGGRRVRRRIKPDIVVCVEFPGLRAIIRDVSTTGAFIEDERPLPVGRGVDLQVRFDKSLPPVEVRAVVRRVEPQVGMAVEFTSLSEEAAAQLRRVVGEKNLCPS